MLQVLYLDVTYVEDLQWLYMYFQVYVPNVSPVLYLCCKYFMWMLHMLQVFIQNVLFVLDLYCKCVYQDVVIAIHICYKHVFVNVSPISDVCCRCDSCCNIN
jgi:hypothetical protein